MTGSRPAPERIGTERLILRRWREEDFRPYAEMQADPVVRRYFERPLTIEEGLDDARRHAEDFARNGFDLWVVEQPGGAAFIGVAGVRRIGRAMPFAPLVDVGWLFLPAFWGRGYAPEAARAALDDVFHRAGLDEVVAYTARLNEPSQAVMRKLGMSRNPLEDFDHPNVSDGHPLRRQVLYRIAVDGFRRTHSSAQGRVGRARRDA